MATTMPGLSMMEATSGIAGCLHAQRRVGRTRSQGKLPTISPSRARNSFAIPLPTGRLMHGVGTVGGAEDVTFTRARVSAPARVLSNPA